MPLTRDKIPPWNHGGLPTSKPRRLEDPATANIQQPVTSSRPEHRTPPHIKALHSSNTHNREHPAISVKSGAHLNLPLLKQALQATKNIPLLNKETSHRKTKIIKKNLIFSGQNSVCRAGEMTSVLASSRATYCPCRRSALA